jgi:DNA-binding NarL/FixJ family response regulator
VKRFQQETEVTIFVADDSAIMRERLASMVAELSGGMKLIGQASDAPQAAEAIRRVKPDVVVLDIHMPGGSGIDVLRKIRKDSPAAVVLMLTNYSYPQFRQRCMDAGADYFFDKSAEFGKVAEVLQRLIQDR